MGNRYSLSVVRGPVWLPAVVGLCVAAPAQPLSIHQIQYTTDPEGHSAYAGQVVDCAGGIVVAKFAGTRPRLVVQDPAYPDGWGGIQVKDWIYPYQMYNDAQVGDWITFTNLLVEEYRGTTTLQRQAAYNPGYQIVSHGQPLPPARLIDVGAIAAPVYGIHPVYGEGWYVADHGAEYLESMRVIVRGVEVTERDLGKAVDNYNLRGAGGDCWASDYMNIDAKPAVYHPFVVVGQHFCAVGGILEQYTYLQDGWDYYQLLTLATPDLAICGDGNSNGVVDGGDFGRSEECATGPQCELLPAGCDPPAWTGPPSVLPVGHCLMMDFDYDGDVDLRDFAAFQGALGRG